MEAIGRIAILKYFNTGRCCTEAEAVQKLLEEHILPLEGRDEWQEFRDHQLYTHEVDAVFRSNMDGLRKVFTYFQKQRLLTESQRSLVADAPSHNRKESTLSIVTTLTR